MRRKLPNTDFKRNEMRNSHNFLLPFVSSSFFLKFSSWYFSIILKRWSKARYDNSTSQTKGVSLALLKHNCCPAYRIQKYSWLLVNWLDSNGLLKNVYKFCLLDSRYLLHWFLGLTSSMSNICFLFEWESVTCSLNRVDLLSCYLLLFCIHWQSLEFFLQIILDMHFSTVEIARFARYPSRHVHQIASAIIAQAIRTFSARGIDPQS